METTLYDAAGHAVAYIAEDSEKSIYLWDGNAVAYLVEEKVYGWNGDHLGWFIDGVAYDTNGYRVGSVKDKCTSITYVQPVKNVKFIKYVKTLRSASHSRPSLKSSYGNQSLRNFLASGRP